MTDDRSRTERKLDELSSILARVTQDVVDIAARVAALEEAYTYRIDAMPFTGPPSDSAFTVTARGVVIGNAALELFDDDPDPMEDL